VGGDDPGRPIQVDQRGSVAVVAGCEVGGDVSTDVDDVGTVVQVRVGGVDGQPVIGRRRTLGDEGEDAVRIDGEGLDTVELVVIHVKPGGVRREHHANGRAVADLANVVFVDYFNGTRDLGLGLVLHEGEDVCD